MHRRLHVLVLLAGLVSASCGDAAARLTRVDPSAAPSGLVLVHHRLADRPLSLRLDREVLESDVVRAFVATGVTETSVSRATRLATEIRTVSGVELGSIEGFVGAIEFRARLERARRLAPQVVAAVERVDAAPRDAGAWLALGERWFELDALDQARRALVRAVELGAGPRALERLARLEVEDGRIAAARSRLDELDEAVADREPLLTEALILLAERRASASLALLEQVAAAGLERSDRERALLEIGLAAHEGGDDPRALRALEDLIEHPTADALLAQRARERRVHILSNDHGHDNP